MKTQIAFLVDCTESMREWRPVVLSHMCEAIARAELDGELEVALVGYTDYDEFDVRGSSVFVPFTTDASRVIRPLTYSPDIDAPEDVAGGLRRTVQLEWDLSETTRRQVIHFADGPPHGLNYHEPWIADRYPQGDPRGLNLEEDLHDLREADVEYTFYSANESTDVFAHVLEGYFGMAFREFRMVDRLRPPRRLSVRELDDYTMQRLQS